MKTKNMVVAAALSIAMVPAFAGDSTAKTAVGGAVGGAGGAAAGQATGVKGGNVVGGAVGGAVGAAVTTSGQGKKGAIVGGAVGGGAGAAIGEQVGGKEGSIIGAGVGGLAGAAVGRELNRGSKPQTTTPGQTQPATKPQASTTVVQAATVATPQTVHPSCKPKHNKGKGWAKGHDKHC